MRIHRDVTCKECIRRLKELGHLRASEVYNVGNPARPGMGHVYYFTKDGKIALCAADRREE